MSPRPRRPSKSERPVERILLRPWEAAEAVGVSVTKLYDLIRSGEVPSVQLGSSLRVPAEWLRDLGRRRRRPPEDPKNPPE